MSTSPRCRTKLSNQRSRMDPSLPMRSYPCEAEKNIQLRNKVPPPLLTRVCRESRAIAFKTGYRLPQIPDPNNIDIQDYTKDMAKQPWLDTTRDTVQIKWEPSLDIWWESYDWGDPIRCLLSYSTGSKSQEASIMLGRLLSYQFGSRSEEPHYTCRWTHSELATFLRTRPSWTVVILPPVVIHTSPGKNLGGLFGLLADAPVQLVDANHDARIKAFLSLGKTLCTKYLVGICAKPEEGDLVYGKESLKEAAEELFGHEKEAPVMRLVVIFRLSYTTCWESDSPRAKRIKEKYKPMSLVERS